MKSVLCDNNQSRIDTKNQRTVLCDSNESNMDTKSQRTVIYDSNESRIDTKNQRTVLGGSSESRIDTKNQRTVLGGSSESRIDTKNQRTVLCGCNKSEIDTKNQRTRICGKSESEIGTNNQRTVICDNQTKTETTNQRNNESKTVKNDKVINISGANSDYRVYKLRWFILFLFSCIFSINALQWIQYTIISDIIQKYYDVSPTMVNNTSIIYLMAYLPLIVPGTYIIEKKGLRFSIIIAALGNCIGSWLKVASTSPNQFYLGFLGQTVLAIVQIFILSIPPKLAGVWFPPSQLSTACAIGVFGSQLGPALGFLITPMAVHDHSDKSKIGDDLFLMFLVMALITTVVLIMTVLFFKNKPKTPPSKGQDFVHIQQNVLKSYLRLFMNGPFVVFLIAYGINIGLFNTISTLIYSLLVPHFPKDAATFAGQIGVLIVATGSVSAILLGIILDKTRKYKTVTVIIYFLTAAGMLLFTFSTHFESKICVYFSSFLLGFFMSGYMTVGYEMATELTYPEPEFISSGILMSISQTSGVLFTVIFEYFLLWFNDFWSNISMVGLLVVGSIITILVPNILKRQDALCRSNNNNKENKK